MSELVFNRVILEKNNRILALLILISLSLNLLLVFGFIVKSTRPPLVVYSQDGQVGILRTRDLKMDEAFLKEFMKMLAGQYLSFAANSLPSQIEAIKPYLASKPLDLVWESYKNNQALIEKDNLSQQFAINTILITKESNPFWVEVEGTRNMHADGNDKSVPITYVFEVKKIKPTEVNPYGFLVTDVIEKDKLVNKGQGK